MGLPHHQRYHGGGTVLTLDNIQLLLSKVTMTTTDGAPTTSVQAWANAARTIPYNGTLNPAPSYSGNNNAVATINAATGVITMAGGTGSVTFTVTAGGKTSTASLNVTAAMTAPASITPSSVTARSAVLTIAAPTDVATNPVNSYNIYRNGNLITNVAYSGASQVYNASFTNSPPGVMDSAGEPQWTWGVTAVRGGVESPVTNSALTTVPIDGWHGDDTPGTGVIWSDNFQYASVAALNTAYGTSYVDGTNAAIDNTVTYNGRPTVKFIGDKRPPKTVDFNGNPLTDVFIFRICNHGSGFTLNQERGLFALHYDDGGASLEAYNAGGDSGNYVGLSFNGAQYLVYSQAKTSGGVVVTALGLNNNVGPSTLMNVAQNDRRFWLFGLRLTSIANGIQVRAYAGLEDAIAGAGGGLQLIYDSTNTLVDATKISGTVKIKSGVFSSSTDSAQAGNKEWMGIHGIVDLTTNPTPFGAFPTAVGYTPPNDPSPVQLGIVSFGPNGISSSTGAFGTVPINSDADFRALWMAGNTTLAYSKNTAKNGTGASTNALVTAAFTNADLMEVDLSKTYTDRYGKTQHMLHIHFVPSYFSDTNPFLSDGVTLNPANDMCPNSSHGPECNTVFYSGHSSRSWLVNRVVLFGNGFNMAAGQNTKSAADYGNWNVISGGTGTAQIAGVTTADQLKGMVFRVISGTGDSTATDTGHFYMAIDTCDASGNITYHGYNGVSTYTIGSDSVLHLVGFNYTQSSAHKLGPHPSNDQTRADLEMSNSTATLDSGNMTGTLGMASARFNGGTDNNYTIDILTNIFGPNWATDGLIRQYAIAFKVTSQTTGIVKVWAGLITDTTLALKYTGNVTFNSGDYPYMKYCNWTGKNFNRNLAAADPTPEYWVGQTEFQDMEESGFAWPSFIPTADRF